MHLLNQKASESILVKQEVKDKVILPLNEQLYL